MFRIVRDEQLIAQLIALEQEFWGYVQRDEAPPADGSKAAEVALRALFPQDCGAVLDWSEDSEMSGVFADLLAVRAVLAQHSQLEAQLKQRIQQRMGQASRALFERGEVSWKCSKEVRSLDTTRLIKDHPDLVQRYQVSRAGSRRFVVVE